MTPIATAKLLLRTALVVAACAGATVPGAWAAGRNHDLQTIRLSPATAPAHDCAPGPLAR